MNANEIRKAQAKFTARQASTFAQQGTETRRNYRQVAALLVANGFCANENIPTDAEYTYYVLGAVTVAVPYTDSNDQVLFDCDAVDAADMKQLRELAHATRRANRSAIATQNTEWRVYA